MMKVRGIIFKILIGFMALSACDAEDSGECEHGGRTYADGAQFTCGDGCNSCTCNEGSVESTTAACTGEPGPAAGKLKCHESDFWHEHGDVWTSDRGCELTCNDGKLVGECA
jgi:hypothetical protein